MSPVLLRLVTMLRLLAFMVLIYAGLAWIVERRSQNPQSKVRAFFRLLISPVVRLVARFLPPGTAYVRVLAVTTGVVAAVWVALVILDEVLGRMQ
ncbi:MAG TPA: hypothetical protein VLD85_03225 [Anaeromyxobacteraceae bacterium]|nr:hypothetical protein [Anaeromyxobacteraceae bacterium]